MARCVCRREREYDGSAVRRWGERSVEYTNSQTNNKIGTQQTNTQQSEIPLTLAQIEDTWSHSTSSPALPSTSIPCSLLRIY